jgi:hypothetical protein
MASNGKAPKAWSNPKPKCMNSPIPYDNSAKLKSPGSTKWLPSDVEAPEGFSKHMDGDGIDVIRPSR